MATERIDIVVSERGSRVVKRNLEDIGGSARRSADGVDLLKRALAGLSVGLVVRELARLADTYTNIQNRLRTVTTGTAQLAVVTDELFQIANRTRQSFEGTAELYSRLGLAAKELGVNQQQLLEFTESLNQAVALSGASATEAENAMIQLSQGLASGALRGDELRSVMEQFPAVADVIAKGLGVTRGELRKMGEEGKITADVVLNAFKEARGELNERFAKSVPTISQAFTVLRNNFTQLVGEFDTANGISRSLAQAIIFVANNLDTLARIAAAAAITVGVVFAQRAVGAAITAVNTLTLAIAANPIGAIAVAITAVIALLITFSDQITIGGGHLATLSDLAAAVWEQIRAALGAFIDFFQNNFGFVADFARSVFGDINLSVSGVLTFGAKIIDRYIDIWLRAYNAIVAAFNGLPAAFRDIFTRALNGAIALVEAGVNKIIGALNTVTEFVGAGTIGNVALGRVGNSAAGGAQRLGETVREGFIQGFNQNAVEGAVNNVLNRADELARNRLAEEAKRKQELGQARQGLGEAGARNPRAGAGAGAGGNQATFEELLNKLKREGELLKLNNQEREIQQGILQLESQLKRTLTADERAMAEEQLRMNQALTDQANILDEIQGPMQDYGRKVSALDKLVQDGRISLEQYAQKLQDVRIAYLDTLTDLSSGLERAFLKINKDLGDSAKQIEEVVTNAFSKAEDALVDFVKTGKLDFKGLVDSILTDLIRLTVRQGILAPIAGALGGALGGLGGGIGGAIASGLGGLFGFATGGDFTVPGGSGVDSQLVAFRATPGEQVIVNKPNTDNQQKDSAGGRTVVNMYITTPDVKGFKESESQIAARASRMIGRGRRNL